MEGPCPPGPKRNDLPPVDEVARLFTPRPEGQRSCPKSTLLFPVFAQYLTDGFLRTDMKDRSRTTSNHDIDLSPLYGRTPAQTRALRCLSPEVGSKGRLKSQQINGEEFPPPLHLPGTAQIDPAYLDPQGQPILDMPLGLSNWDMDDMARRQIFALGGDRANATALVAMMNTLFLREHNRLAGTLEVNHPGWDDDRVFETARNIVIALFIKIVVEEYINHISSACFRLRADPRVAWRAGWNKPNWMTVEFSLLYRWHSLVPYRMQWDNGDIDFAELLFDNSRLTSSGLTRAFVSTSQTPAARLGLHNTPLFLESPTMAVEARAIQQNRDQRLQGYNAYRKAMNLKPVDGFDCMTADTGLQNELAELYGQPDNVDFYVALFAEDAGPNSPMPPLLGAMVALDAFSQALNNPLLSKQVFNARTFTEYGMDIIETTRTLGDILARNPGPELPKGFSPRQIRMTRDTWRRSFGTF